MGNLQTTFFVGVHKWYRKVNYKYLHLSLSDKMAGIEAVILMSLKNEISWKMLDLFLEELTPTLDKSKQVIKILVKELQALQSSIQKMKAECDCHKMIGTADTTKDSEQEYNTQMEIIEPECQLEIENNLSQNNKDMISDVPKDDSFTASKSDNEVLRNRIHSDDLNSIELVEEFKDQLYTFIGNDVESYDKEERHEVIYLNEDQAQVDIDKETEKKQFHCTFCQKSFRKSGHLKNHERIHTGEVPFECNTCKKRFKQIGHLKTHERFHTGEKPFICKACKKGFATSSALKVHERIHSGEKPYICKTCKKGFTQSYDLKKHERIHTGEMPFKCKTCQKLFSYNESCKRHERIHTDDNEKPIK